MGNTANPGVNIVVTANTTQGAAEMTKFSTQTTQQLLNVARAAETAGKQATVTANQLKTAAGGLGNVINSVARTSALFVGPQAASAIASAQLFTHEIKGLSAAMKLTGASGPVAAAGIFALVAALATGVTYSQKLKAELEEIRTRGELARVEGQNRSRLFDLLDQNKYRLDPGEAEKLSAELYLSLETSQMRSVEAKVRDRLRAVILGSSEQKALDDIYDSARANNVARQDEFKQEEVRERQRFESERRRIAATEEFAKTQTDFQIIQDAYDQNRQRHEFEMARIQKDRDEKAVRAQSQITEEIRRREKAADEFYAREEEHARRMAEMEREKNIQRIERSPFITEAERYRQLQGAGVSKDELGADPSSFAEQMAVSFVTLQDQIGTVAQNVAGMFNGVVSSAITSVSAGITGLIMGTMTWGQALLNIATTILTTVVQAIVQMGIRWIATQIMIAVAGKSILASSIATAAPLAAAQSAVWATPATLATIASYGAAAAAAPGLIEAAKAITLASSLTGFADGGYTGDGGKFDPAGIVHRGEYVMPASAVNRIGLPALDAMRSGSGGSSSAGRQVVIYLVDTESAVRRVMDSHIGDEIMVRRTNKNRLDVGLNT